MGLSLALGMREGFRIFNLICNKMIIAYESMGRTALAISYANGGHLLAVSQGSSISLIDCYTFEHVFSLSGHPSAV